LKRIQKKNREWLNGKDKKRSFYVFICFKCLEHKKFRIAGRQAGSIQNVNQSTLALKQLETWIREG